MFGRSLFKLLIERQTKAGESDLNRNCPAVASVLRQTLDYGVNDRTQSKI